MLAGVGARVALKTLEEARASPREWTTNVAQLRRDAEQHLRLAHDPVDPDTQANRAFARALWRCVDRSLESQDPAACQLPSTLSDPTFRLEQAIQECASYGGHSEAAAFAAAADEFLARESAERVDLTLASGRFDFDACDSLVEMPAPIRQPSGRRATNSPMPSRRATSATNGSGPGYPALVCSSVRACSQSADKPCWLSTSPALPTRTRQQHGRC